MSRIGWWISDSLLIPTFCPTSYFLSPASRLPSPFNSHPWIQYLPKHNTVRKGKERKTERTRERTRTWGTKEKQGDEEGRLANTHHHLSTDARNLLRSSRHGIGRVPMRYAGRPCRRLSGQGGAGAGGRVSAGDYVHQQYMQGCVEQVSWVNLESEVL